MAKKPSTRTVTRDAKTGKFVEKKQATRRPASTVTEKVPIPNPKRKK